MNPALTINLDIVHDANCVAFRLHATEGWRILHEPSMRSMVVTMKDLLEQTNPTAYLLDLAKFCRDGHPPNMTAEEWDGVKDLSIGGIKLRQPEVFTPASIDSYEHIDQTTDLDQLRRIAKGWMEDCARHLRNEEFYCGIVHETGHILGRECYRQDDGSYVDEVLALRVPEVTQAHADRLARLLDFLNEQCAADLPTDAFLAYSNVRDRVRLILPSPIAAKEMT